MVFDSNLFKYLFNIYKIILVVLVSANRIQKPYQRVFIPVERVIRIVGASFRWWLFQFNLLCGYAAVSRSGLFQTTTYTYSLRLTKFYYKKASQNMVNYMIFKLSEFSRRRRRKRATAYSVMLLYSGTQTLLWGVSVANGHHVRFVHVLLSGNIVDIVGPHCGVPINGTQSTTWMDCMASRCRHTIFGGLLACWMDGWMTDTDEPAPNAFELVLGWNAICYLLLYIISNTTWRWS